MQNIFVTHLEDFETIVLQASYTRPILVDFWAEWCSPCLVIAPVLEKVINEYDGKIALAKLEVDAGENMKFAGRYKVRGFPTIILIKNAEELGRFSGAKTQSAVKQFIDALVQ